MPNSSACRGKKQCAQCPKAVDNAIIYASHLRGFHLPARKCEENIIIFLLKGEVLVNSKERELCCMQVSSSFKLLVPSTKYLP